MLTQFHREITRRALAPYFTDEAVEIALRANDSQDNLRGQIAHPEYHVDNAVAPGYIRTQMTDVLPENVKEEMKKLIPLGRFGNGEDIAHAAVFLASPESGYITGQVVHVNGGMYM